MTIKTPIRWVSDITGYEITFYDADGKALGAKEITEAINAVECDCQALRDQIEALR